MLYSTWDEIILKVNDTFGYDHKIFVELRVIVLGNDVSNGDTWYLCYIPPTEKIPRDFQTVKINTGHITRYGAKKTFLGEQGCFIIESDPIFRHIPATPGAECKRCKTWVDFAEESEAGYRCRDCRINPYR